MKRRDRSKPVLGLLLSAMALCLASPKTAGAGPIVQDASNEARNIFPWVGQSFTAEDMFIDIVGAYVTDFTFGSVATDTSIVYSLYEGIGTGGTLLGSRTFSGLFEGFDGFADVSFAGIPLIVGNPYSFIVSNDTAEWGVESAFGDFYAGGALLLPVPDEFEREMRFHVLPAAEVPEPATLLLLGAGLAAAALRLRHAASRPAARRRDPRLPRAGRESRWPRARRE